MSAPAATNFVCPVAWCIGGVAEHGGDSAPPEDWMHFGDVVAVGGGFWVQRWRIGAEAERWQLNSGSCSGLAEAADAETLAVLLERAALELRGRVRD